MSDKLVGPTKVEDVAEGDTLLDVNLVDKWDMEFMNAVNISIEIFMVGKATTTLYPHGKWKISHLFCRCTISMPQVK